jgi:hypothetical protein
MSRATARVDAGLILTALILTALLLAALPAAAIAQEVRGVALDPRGEPLPGVVVALHRVGDTGPGANVASETTDAEGRFHFLIETPDSALYFAAMRYDGSMYIGPPALAGVERVDGYRLVADPAAEAGAVASILAAEGAGGTFRGQAAGQAPPRAANPDDGGRAILLVVGLVALVAAALFLVAAPRYRQRRTRDALVELATVENRLADGPSPQDRVELTRQRDHLRERLAPPV